jgi:polyisoprenoid-binding protein YceI
MCCGVLLIAFSARADGVSYLLTKPNQVELRFTVEAPFDTINGNSRAVVGAANWDATAGTASAKFIADASTFRTGIDLRDQDLREQFFEVGKHPNIVLEIARVRWKQQPAPGKPGEGTAEGTLALHGVTQNLSFPIYVTPGELEGKLALYVRCTFPVKFTNFGIQRPRCPR